MQILHELAGTSFDEFHAEADKFDHTKAAANMGSRGIIKVFWSLEFIFINRSVKTIGNNVPNHVAIQIARVRIPLRDLQRIFNKI